MSRVALYYDLAPFYDRLYARKDYRQESAELLRLARHEIGRPPRTLLDVGCGTGRHLEAFSRTLDCVGTDLSPSMLDRARERLGASFPLVRGDMRRFRLRRRFDVVTCLFSAIGYMRTRADRDAALANFARHLNPGGVVLVVGWVLPERWRGDTTSLLTYDGPEATVARVTRSSLRGGTAVLTMHYLVGEKGRPIRHLKEEHRQSLVSADEMLGSFRRAGLRARVVRSGRWTDRGLYVGVRPADPVRGRVRKVRT